MTKSDVISEKPVHCIFIFMVNTQKSKLDRLKTMGTHGKINAIWWDIKVNLQKLVHVCEYELPTNLQNFTQKDWTEAKIFQKVLRATIFETPCIYFALQEYLTDFDEIRGR